MSKRRTTLTVLALIVSLGLSSAPALADKGGNGNGNGNSGNHGNSGNNGNHGNNGKHGNKAKGNDGDQGLVSVSISRDRARSLAQNYGLTGYGSLPPGIAKNLARGKPLPPGIAKKMVPSSMLRDLPYYPGYEWRIAGDDLVLVALSTALVASVINGVFN
ncbi:anti-virulence regulator CigR family protein [Serratia proteamaculans]|uniref:anti-virulence regulator CigR family protein n=1 Tax=Serratia proteamaculans TaxID=28151 RepID=UPI00217AE137|nr:anti-virulence regulator CigR family protein [Serratia proteamaculans]CAI0843495.1 Predicted integral membrane protein [Serratia proteamaculans]CAI2074218.1 Predicted integral membrane protein [Serratia proteamaculans]